MTKIFVYGSLKKDYWNHRYLGDSKFVTKLNLMGYKLYTDGIPYMVKTAIPEDRVAGEIYEVDDDTLGLLDDLEGHPNWYKREIVSAHDLQPVEAYVYYEYIAPRMKEAEKREGAYVF